MRGFLSTVAGKSLLVAAVVLSVVVYWSGLGCEEQVRLQQQAGTVEAGVADDIIQGIWRWHILSGAVVFAAVGSLGVIAVRAERRFYTTNASLTVTTDELQDLSLARTGFLAMMSHELRTPLNSIIGFSGILTSGMAGDLTVEQRKQVGIINSAGKQLLALINDILDLSKLETGKLILVAEEFRVVSVVDAVTDTLRPLAEDRGLELRVRISDPDLTMCTDCRRLEQILLSIVSRAVRMTESGHVLIEVEATGSGDIVFRVSDTSAGMTAEEIAGLFEEHGEADPRPGRSRSTGFALMVSRRLAVTLGGDIIAESELGLGSEFTLRLPEVVDEALCA